MNGYIPDPPEHGHGKSPAELVGLFRRYGWWDPDVTEEEFWAQVVTDSEWIESRQGYGAPPTPSASPAGLRLTSPPPPGGAETDSVLG